MLVLSLSSTDVNSSHNPAIYQCRGENSETWELIKSYSFETSVLSDACCAVVTSDGNVEFFLIKKGNMFRQLF
jgi:hypothetical protein